MGAARTPRRARRLRQIRFRFIFLFFPRIFYFFILIFVYFCFHSFGDYDFFPLRASVSRCFYLICGYAGVRCARALAEQTGLAATSSESLPREDVNLFDIN